MAQAPDDKMDLVTDDELNPDIIQNFVNRFYKSHPNDIEKYGIEAIRWYQRQVSKQLSVKPSQLLNQKVYKKRSGAEAGLIGKLYFFQYDAEQAGDPETGLFDQFPMVFIFNAVRNKDGQMVLYGLNMHYLAPAERAVLYIELLKLKTSKKFTPRSRLRAEWNLIKAVTKSSLAERAVHAYRVDRLMSRLIEIPAPAWQIAVFLRLEKWLKPKSGDMPFLPSDMRKKIAKKGKGVGVPKKVNKKSFLHG